MIPTPEWDQDLADETNRKCLETLEELMAAHNRGQIDSDQYVCTLLYLDKAWRGLIDRDITAAIDTEIAEWGPEVDVVRTSLLRKDKKLLILRQVNERLWQGRVNLNEMKIVDVDTNSSKDPIAAAKRAYSLVTKEAVKRGYTELFEEA